MDKHFVSSSAVGVDTYSEWTHIENSEINHSDDQSKAASTDKHAPSDVEGEFYLLDPPHPSQGDGEVNTTERNNQPSFLGGIWSSVSTFGTQLIGGNDKSPLPPIDEHTQQNMASKEADEQKPKTGRRLLGRIKNVWKSEDDTKV